MQQIYGAKVLLFKDTQRSRYETLVWLREIKLAVKKITRLAKCSFTTIVGGIFP